MTKRYLEKKGKGETALRAEDETQEGLHGKGERWYK